MSLGSSYQVQVSRMMRTPLDVARLILDGSHGGFRSRTSCALRFPLMRNSRRSCYQRPLSFLWRRFVSPASAPSLLRTIKRRLVTTCTGNGL